MLNDRNLIVVRMMQVLHSYAAFLTLCAPIFFGHTNQSLSRCFTEDKRCISKLLTSTSKSLVENTRKALWNWHRFLLICQGWSRNISWLMMRLTHMEGFTSGLIKSPSKHMLLVKFLLPSKTIQTSKMLPRRTLAFLMHPLKLRAGFRQPCFLDTHSKILQISKKRTTMLGDKVGSMTLQETSLGTLPLHIGIYGLYNFAIWGT